jgi:hypothetical protein
LRACTIFLATKPSSLTYLLALIAVSEGTKYSMNMIVVVAMAGAATHVWVHFRCVPLQCGPKLV